jgi:hypothetical protein
VLALLASGCLLAWCSGPGGSRFVASHTSPGRSDGWDTLIVGCSKGGPPALFSALHLKIFVFSQRFGCYFVLRCHLGKLWVTSVSEVFTG